MVGVGILFLIVVLVVLGRLIGSRLFRFPIAPRWLMAVGGVVILAGGALSIAQMNRLIHDYSIRTWPTVTGKIISSEVKGDRAFHPEVVYEYNIDNVGKGDHVRYVDTSFLQQPSFGGKRRRYETAQKLIEPFPSGSNVTVYYNRLDHTDSRLLTKLAWDTYGRAGFGLFLFTFGLILVSLPRRGA